MGKVCTKCGSTDFYKSGQCKPCTRARQLVYAHEHAEDNRQRAKEWKKANPGKRRTREQDRVHWKKYYQKHAEQRREYNRVYNKSNRALRKARDARYRARKLAATIGDVSINRVIERDGMVCYLCGQPIEPGQLHIDHVWPLAEGGAHVEDNLKPTHAHCNLSKNSTQPTLLDYALPWNGVASDGRTFDSDTWEWTIADVYVYEQSLQWALAKE
jgi:5-methylcytosine-specific restriction endonuclease McrA